MASHSNQNQSPLDNFVTRSEFESLQNRVEQYSSLVEVSIIINSTLDLEVLLNLVMEKAQSVMCAEASSVMLVNDETERLECYVALGVACDTVKEKIQLKRGQGIAGTVWETGHACIVPNVHEDNRFFPDVDLQSGFETHSIIAAPLKVRNRIIGVAEVLNRRDGKEFTRENLALFETFCRQVAMAIENAQLHKFELEQERLKQQLESARAIQESFMPQQIPYCPKGRFTLAGRTRPAKIVGGDFYDFIVFDDDYLGIAIGDVSGKGIPAALYMARLVSDFRFQAQKRASPGETLTALNDQLVERSLRGMFVTMQYLVIDLNSGNVQIADAGHLAPLLVSKNELIQLDLAGGLPLGIIRGTKFETTHIHLHSNDTLCLYTDGAIEAKNSRGERFSLKRLQGFVLENTKAPDQFVKQLLYTIAQFAKNVPQYDDITVLMLKRGGT